jgi:hypothetical protein
MKKKITMIDGRPVYLHDDHKKPTNRREFLSSGLLGFSGWIFAPSILQTVFSSSQAQAAGCGPVSASALPSFMTVNFSGGPGMTGYFVPMGKDGSTLSTYNGIGLGKNPNIVKIFNDFPVPVYGGSTNYGGALKTPAANIPAGTMATTNLPAGVVDPTTPFVSQFIQGIMMNINTEIQGHVSMTSVLVRSQDDSGGNPFDISGLVQSAGLAGDTLPSLGNVNTGTGIGQSSALVKPSAPSIVGAYSDITNAIALHQKVRTQLNNDPKLQQSLLKLVKNLSGSQANRLVASVGSSSAQTLSDLVSCATGKNYNLSSDPTIAAGLDPMQNSNVAGLWRLGNNAAVAGQGQAERYAQSGMVYNLLQGHSGTVGINLGGNDYHGNPRTTTDATDYRNGSVVGMALATAHALKKPLFIYCTADGATGSNVSDMVADWSGDRGGGGAAFMIAYDPNGRPNVKPGFAGNQLGSMSEAQAADEAEPTGVGGSVTRAASAVFRNYLEFGKSGAIFDKIIAAGTSASFDSSIIDKVLKFGA